MIKNKKIEITFTACDICEIQLDSDDLRERLGGEYATVQSRRGFGILPDFVYCQKCYKEYIKPGVMKLTKQCRNKGL